MRLIYIYIYIRDTRLGTICTICRLLFRMPSDYIHSVIYMQHAAKKFFLLSLLLYYCVVIVIIVLLLLLLSLLLFLKNLLKIMDINIV